jgi:5'-methylthioadenosine phosphorylase
MQEVVQPRDFVVLDQISDRTKGVGPFTFFEGGIVGYESFGDPFEKWLADIVRKCGHALEGDGVTLHDKGTLFAREDRAGSNLYRSSHQHLCTT